MNTLFLLLNHCHPHPQMMEAMSNKDPKAEAAIAIAICITIIIGTIVVAVLLSKWHKRTTKESAMLRQMEAQKAETERKAKMRADYQVRILDYIKANQKVEGFDAAKDPYLQKIEQFMKEL